MLPALLYQNMEGCSNQNSNPNFGLAFDESVILNSVRNRKKVSELPSCPICSCTIRQGELESHLTSELDKLQKLSCCGAKRKLSCSPGSNLAVPGSSTSGNGGNEEDVDVTGCVGSDVYQRVKHNRLKRLRPRKTPPTTGQCPLCDMTLPTTKLQRHALRCLKRSGADMDEDIPDTSSEEGSIDVENDSPSANTFTEYQWCGEWRVRASALQEGEGRAATSVRRDDNEGALVVDGDEDIELYGPAQYSPSRIAPEPEETSGNLDSTMSDTTTAHVNTDMNISTEDIRAAVETPTKRPNGVVELSAETRIHALKARIKELEARQIGGVEAKCLICLGSYTSPAVSIQCWHVHCEVCWLDSLRAKKICPQCNAITTTHHLRRIYM